MAVAWATRGGLPPAAVSSGTTSMPPPPPKMPLTAPTAQPAAAIKKFCLPRAIDFHTPYPNDFL